MAYINEALFEAPSKKRDYLLGHFAWGATPLRDSGFMYRASREGLAERVATLLDTTYTITQAREGANSWMLQAYDAPYIRSVLEGMGLLAPKKERGFPSGIVYLEDFVRGVFERRGIVRKRNGIPTLSLVFNPDFNGGLCEVLREHAGFKNPGGAVTYLQLGIADTVRLVRWVHSDPGRLMAQGIADSTLWNELTAGLAKKRELNRNSRRRDQRLNYAMRLIEQGVPLKGVARKVRYSHYTALARAFKAEIGMTPTKYRAQLDS